MGLKGECHTLDRQPIDGEVITTSTHLHTTEVDYFLSVGDVGPLGMLIVGQLGDTHVAQIIEPVALAAFLEDTLGMVYGFIEATS